MRVNPSNGERMAERMLVEVGVDALAFPPTELLSSSETVVHETHSSRCAERTARCEAALIPMYSCAALINM